MKLSRHAFVRFWDVHAWLGVVAGIVLHVMFFAGAFALFHGELGGWQEGPAKPVIAKSDRPGIGSAIDRALREKGARPTEIDIWMPGGDTRSVEMSWRSTGATAERIEVRLDTATGEVTPRTSHLATILYWLHFLYHPKAAWGMYVAGVLGLALVLAIVTGVLIHVKDLARQFHQFRPGKTTRVLWSDMHKVLGVMGLPFQLMYAFTGSLLCFVSVALMLFVGPVFKGDRDAARASLWGGPPKSGSPAGPPGEALELDILLERARTAVPGFRPEFIRVERTGDTPTTLSFWGSLAGRLFRRGDIVLRARDGALLADTVSAYPTPGSAVSRWVTGLHYAWFGGLAAKVLYALLAAATCLTILTGNWIWLARREARAESLGNRLLSKLTLGVGGGVLVATAALFWANRLAPSAARMTAESWAFFGVWTGCALLHLVRADARRGWVGLLRVAGAAFALVPIAGIVSRGWRPATPDGLVARPGGVEIGLVLLGLALWGVASIVRRRTNATAEIAQAPVVSREATPEGNA